MHKFIYWLISSNFLFHYHILGLKFFYLYRIWENYIQSDIKGYKHFLDSNSHLLTLIRYVDTQPSSCPGHQPEASPRCHRNNHKHIVSKTRSSHATEILWKSYTIGRALSKISPATYQAQKFKEYRFQGVPKY